MTEAGGKKRQSLTALAAMIRVVQQLLRTAGPTKCGNVRQSEFDSLLDQLDELHDLLQWLDRNKTDFLAWRGDSDGRRPLKRDDGAPHNGMMAPPDYEMISPPVTE